MGDESDPGSPGDDEPADDPATVAGPGAGSAADDVEGGGGTRSGDGLSGSGPRSDSGRTAGDRGPITRFREADSGPLVVVRDLLSSALMVLLVAGLLFGVSGVWPPMVAVKSGSMNPHMYKGDLVFVAEEHRFAGDAAVEGTGVVTHRAGAESGYRKFGGYGDVVVYRPNNASTRDPIIHRARFYVEEGENWYDRANESYLPPGVDSCEELQYCPAEEGGFITKGDNPRSNQYYDQARGMSRPVQPEWVEAKAVVRVPALGWIRLKWAELQRGGVSVGVALVLVGGWKRRAAA